MGQVWEQELHAFSPVPPVVCVFVDMDDNESGDWELGDGSHQFGAALVAAAVPVEFRLADS
ncbi:hypothetical protein SRL2020028_48870 [Mycobacterium kiyosense]|uniref:Uncharacterized protein n=1 Tax=Mycobacterium kiyosense TaxID=2871094 RepID=A0AA37PWN7_9MYCO|nr:hypothetical protein MINTM011_50640 [Mycobacterium paraintracellulare]GLB85631.1 hypothetical protein SRL2020028_48870 [Mycobacterium kiyosense]